MSILPSSEGKGKHDCLPAPKNIQAAWAAGSVRLARWAFEASGQPL